MMGAFVERRDEGTGTSGAGSEQTAAIGRRYFSEADVGTFVDDRPRIASRIEARVRYGETESLPTDRRVVPSTETRPFDVVPKQEQVHALINDCNELFRAILETEDVIDRENMYRTLSERLFSLFALRPYRERTFGHLIVLLLGVIQNTTSEFFSEKQFLALDRVISLAKKFRITDADLRDAERLLAAADFELFRPIRGTFDSENA